MSSSFFIKVAAITILVIGFCAVLMALLPGDAGDKAPLVGGIVLLLLLIGVLVYFIFMPRLYQKKLEDKGSKSLRRYIMTDPRFQEALKSSAEKWQGGEAASQNAAPQKKQESENQPQHTEESGETGGPEQEKKKSPQEPPDEDDLFG